MAALIHSTTKPAFARWSRPEAPVLMLLAASLLVGLAIATSGAASKAINGAGGLLWLAAAASLAIRLRQSSEWRKLAPFSFALTLTLVLLVKPTDFFWAAAGFLIAGMLLSLAARQRWIEWAGFLAAIWLPTHLLVAVARVIERSIRDVPAHVRTDPPPTAALVPFAMVCFALAGAWLVELFRSRRA